MILLSTSAVGRTTVLEDSKAGRLMLLTVLNTGKRLSLTSLKRSQRKCRSFHTSVFFITKALVIRSLLGDMCDQSYADPERLHILAQNK